MVKFDLLCVGDSTVDIFAFPDQSHVHCQLHNRKKCELCLAYASKVPAKGFSLTFGGNAANVSVGASRLGVKTAIYTHLGDDLFGKEVLKNFKKEKVSTSLLEIDKKERTRVNIILSAQGERTILSSQVGRDYNLPKASAKWLYFSSVAPQHAKLHYQIPAFVLKTGAKLIFNPGSYQIKEGRRILGPILEVTEALLLNRDEAGQLLGAECALEGEEKCLRRLRNLGPRFVVVTDGPRGAYGFGAGGEFLFQKTYPLKLVERTGAGDAFSAGFAAALVGGKDLKEALRWGTVNAAFATQKVGAQTGLLKKAELLKVLRRWRR
ncbi:hypothetical protein COY35_02135 [candidate division WWE3 bacterium CG_4_10_14_0_2_um_filter_47_8]|nr:MAG: hypothetical protein COY35_02135 [candidate division WWE3 bacterium CG_4_10_14_0_2_um_filter_47_8]